MAGYENAPSNDKLASFITNHKSMPREEEPETTGVRVDAYTRVLRHTFTNNIVQTVFTRSEKIFDQCPSTMNKESLLKLREYCTSEDARSFYMENYRFQDEAVKKWNSYTEEPTGSLYLGFVGIDEGTQQGAGTICLDLVLKGTTMDEVEPGKWKAADGHEDHRNIFNGDRKSIEMANVYHNRVKGREISLTDANLQLEEFDKVMRTIFHAPGDWHTGLNTIQSIFKCWYKRKD